jgi:hypothetical protein
MFNAGWVNPNSSFNSADYKVENGTEKYVWAYVGSAIAANTPVYCLPMGSGLMATALAASTYGVVGVANEAVSSGCMGWIQIEGKASDVQCGAADCVGSVGHAVFWGATALGASTSAYLGVLSQVGMLLEEVNASTTCTIYLTGTYATPIA